MGHQHHRSPGEIPTILSYIILHKLMDKGRGYCYSFCHCTVWGSVCIALFPSCVVLGLRTVRFSKLLGRREESTTTKISFHVLNSNVFLSSKAIKREPEKNQRQLVLKNFLSAFFIFISDKQNRAEKNVKQGENWKNVFCIIIRETIIKNLF